MGRRRRINARPPEQATLKRIGALWWLYAGVLVAVGLGRMTERIARESGGFESRYGPPIGATILAISVCCAARRKPAGRARMWGVVLLATYTCTVGLLALEFLLLRNGAPMRIHALTLGGAALLVPAQFVLDRFVFRSPEVWRRATVDLDGSGSGGA